MFENWTKRRAEQMDSVYAAEKTAERRAELSKRISDLVSNGKTEDALSTILSLKKAQELRLLPVSEADARMRAAAEDEVQFLNELEANVLKVGSRKAA